MFDAVIPAAGKGTRMQPVTGGEPKELLPVLGIPLIVHTLQETVDAGATRIFLIVSPKKPEIWRHLEKKAHFSIHGSMVRFNELGRFGIECIFLEQVEPSGVAHALSLAEPYIGKHDFLVLMPDNYFPERPAPAVQLIHNYNSGHCCLGILKLTPEELPSFHNAGIVTFEHTDEKTVKITSMSEKKSGNFAEDFAASIYRSIGRSIYSRDFFHVYNTMEHPETTEIDDTLITRRLIDDGKMDGFILQGTGYDAGNPAGYSAACHYHHKQER